MVPLLASFLAAAALAGATPQPTRLVAGPVFAGDRVVWGEQGNGLNTLRAAHEATPLWQSGSSWFSGPLAGSANLIAFSRSYNGCPDQPGFACPIETQAIAGPPRGSLRPLAPAERCSAGGAGRRLAVSGERVAYLALACTSSSYTVLVSEHGRVVFRHAASCCDVSLAGSYLAFKSGAAVDLFDLRTNRLVSRTGPPPDEPIAGFDVQADGKLAVVLRPMAGGNAALAWRAPAASALHQLTLPVVLPFAGPAVRLVADHTVVVSLGSGSTPELVSADLLGHVHTLARFARPVEQAGGIDATQTSVTWASRRITSTRADCPPPGQMRPCILLKSGVETVWVAGLASGRVRVVARWSFTDST
jgi:hypothetical protein